MRACNTIIKQHSAQRLIYIDSISDSYLSASTVQVTVIDLGGFTRTPPV